MSEAAWPQICKSKKLLGKYLYDLYFAKELLINNLRRLRRINIHLQRRKLQAQWAVSKFSDVADGFETSHMHMLFINSTLVCQDGMA